jgi:hypothetical protein
VASGATDTEIKVGCHGRPPSRVSVFFFLAHLCQVREATNSDKWGPTGQQMKEISVSGASRWESVVVRF